MNTSKDRRKVFIRLFSNLRNCQLEFAARHDSNFLNRMFLVSQQVPQGVPMVCPQSQVHPRSFLRILTPQWDLRHQDHPTECPCMCLPELQYLTECPLHSDPWDQMDLIARKEHPQGCLRRVCRLCLVWQVHHRTDFRRKWGCHRTDCTRHLIQ